MDCETIVFTTNKEKCAVQQRGLDWNWRYFTAWLRIICLYPLPASASKAANGIALLVRFMLFLINVGAHVAQIFLFYKLGYETSSTTEYWNAVIDYWNWTLHNLSVHCLIFGVNLRHSKWLQLNKLLVKIDTSMQPYESKTSLRLKNRSILGLVYIAFAVRQMFAK